MFGERVDQSNYRCHKLSGSAAEGGSLFGVDKKSSGCFYEGVTIPVGYSMFINRYVAAGTLPE